MKNMGEFSNTGPAPQIDHHINYYCPRAFDESIGGLHLFSALCSDSLGFLLALSQMFPAAFHQLT